MKYLDNNGLNYFTKKIKAWLSGKQDTLVSGTNIKTINNQSLLGSGNINVSGDGDFGLPTLGEEFRIWDLEPGIYVTTTEDWKAYYYGATSTHYKLGSGKNALVVIYSYTNAAKELYKMFMIFGGNAGNRYCYHGSTYQSYGENKVFDFEGDFLTPSDIKNNLTYSTNGNDYALSAYQGYLIDQRLKALETCPYAIGDVYITTNSTDPSTKWSGTTWVKIAKGRTLVGVDENDADFNTVEKTGGSKYMQEHNHLLDIAGGSGGTVPAGYAVQYAQYGSYAINGLDHSTTGEFQNWGIQKSGTGDSENLQPYFTCYIWKRTA